MSDPYRAGAPADRTIIVEGPFRAAHERDDHWAQATIAAHGHQYRVAAVIPGQSDFHHFFGMTDEEREEARGWFALIELARAPTKAFEPSPSGRPREVTVRIAQAAPLPRWTIDDVLNHAHQQLRGYALKREGSTWQAQPPTPQAQPTAPQAQPTAPQARPTASPEPPQASQPPQPRLQPGPAPSGQRPAQWKPGSVQQLGRRRPLKITFDRELDFRPSAGMAAKKGLVQTFLDVLAEAIRSLRRM